MVQEDLAARVRESGHVLTQALQREGVGRQAAAQSLRPTHREERGPSAREAAEGTIRKEGDPAQGSVTEGGA